MIVIMLGSIYYSVEEGKFISRSYPLWAPKLDYLIHTIIYINKLCSSFTYLNQVSSHKEQHGGFH